MKKKIYPLVKKCKCGNKVKNHHFLCDKCWGDKQRRIFQKQKRKVLIDSFK